MLELHKKLAERGNVNSMLYLANHYKKNKEYSEMIKYYLFAIEIDNNDTAKIKLGKYFEFIKNDFDIAKNFYEKISLNNRHVKRIEEKCYALIQIGIHNPIHLNKSCNLCCNDNIDIFRLKKCCKQKICIKCVSGVINQKYNFICPFCRDFLIIDNDVDLFDTDSENDRNDDNFINGTYYEDEQ
jgi:hypothetical protein